MATYRLSVNVAKRSEARSATAMAAYRACEAVTDHRTGEQHDYTRKQGLLFSEIIAPEDAPEWARDRSELWNRSEAAHRKGNAVVTREIQLSLPHEMDNVQRREVAQEFAQHIAQSYGVAVDLCLHAPHKDGDERNYHAHLMICLRRFDETTDTGLSKTNVREFDPVACQKAGGENHVTQWRETWEEMLNRALDRANIRDSDGQPVTVDHRSYEAREIDQEPQIKEGPAATAKKRRGEETDRGQVNDEIKARNAAKLDAEELRRRQAQQITERAARDVGLKETPAAPEPTTRQAKDSTARRVQEQITPANDNKPAAPSLQRKPWESEEVFQQRIKAASDRTQQPEPVKEIKPDPAERMKPKPWETAAEFEKRKQAMRDREKQPLNLDLKPKGPTRHY